MFRRIPRPSLKPALWVALPVGVVALAFLLVGWQQPEEPGIRFRFPGIWNVEYYSLDEPGVIGLFNIDLSAYQFPIDFPLTIDRSAVYLKVPLETGQILVPIQFSLSGDCAPSPDLKKLLCATPPGSAVTYNLLREQQDAATAAWQEYLTDHAEFFVITPGIPQISPIPWGKCENCDFFFKTFCNWWSTTRISCSRAYGTGFWGTSLFDLDSRSYVELPHKGELVVGDIGFNRGYLYINIPFTLEVYDLNRAMVFQGEVEDWTASENAVAFVGPCGTESYCAGKLELDEHGLRGSRQQVLDTSWSPGTTGTHIVETRNEYLITSNGKVFVLSRATLQVRRTFEYPEARAVSHELQMIPVYMDQDLLVAVDHLSGIEVSSRATAFDLSKCRSRLDDSCKILTWDSVKGPAGAAPWQQRVRHHIYYSPIDRPNLIFSIDEDTRRLTIHDLKNWADYSFDLAGLPSPVMTSTDGYFLLVRTIPEYWQSPSDYQYSLFDLRTMQPDSRELVAGKNLFLISGDTR